MHAKPKLVGWTAFAIDFTETRVYPHEMATNVFMATNISLLDVGHCLMFGFPHCFTFFSFLPSVGVNYRRLAACPLPCEFTLACDKTVHSAI